MSVRVAEERTVVIVAMEDDEDFNDSLENDEVVVVDQALKDVVEGDVMFAGRGDVMGSWKAM